MDLHHHTVSIPHQIKQAVSLHYFPLATLCKTGLSVLSSLTAHQTKPSLMVYSPSRDSSEERRSAEAPEECVTVRVR